MHDGTSLVDDLCTRTETPKHVSLSLSLPLRMTRTCYGAQQSPRVLSGLPVPISLTSFRLLSILLQFYNQY